MAKVGASRIARPRTGRCTVRCAESRNAPKNMLKSPRRDSRAPADAGIRLLLFYRPVTSVGNGNAAGDKRWFSHRKCRTIKNYN